MTEGMAPSLTAALERLAVALLVGFLIGLDRERAEVRKEHRLFAGVRTFPLIALVGAMPMLMPAPAGSALLVASFVAVAAVALVSYLRSSAAGDIGATTEVAALATFLLGALAGAGQLVVAAAAGVTVAVLLVAKPRLEAFSHALTPEEVSAALELAVISVIVLPVLPDRGYGPWAVLNPRQIWLVVVLVSALSFVGFIAMRVLGERRGLVLTGALGGLVSSTAMTLAMAERSRLGDAPATAAAAAVLASTVMCLRIGVLAGAVNAGVLPGLLPPLAVMTAAGVGAAWWLARTRAAGPAAPGARLGNPFRLRAALTFGGVYALVLVVVQGAQQTLGEAGMYGAAALAAVADVDAPTVAFARLAGGAAGWRAPVAAITIAAVANTLVKLGLAATLGAGPFRRQVTTALGAMAFVGALAGAMVFARP